MTALQDMFKSLQYFSVDENNEFIPLYEKWMGAKDSAHETIQLTIEMQFVNKIQSIGRYKEYLEQYKYSSSFKREFFKKIITSPTSITDSFGMIKDWGMSMTTEEFDTYEEFYDTIYVTSIIN